MNGALYYNVETQTVNSDLRMAPPPYSETVPTVTEITQVPIIHNTVIVQPILKHNPKIYNCPNCHKTIITRVVYVNTKKTHLFAGFVCGFTLWCLMCCLAAIPYMMPTLKKAEHYCPECNKFLGSHSL